MVSDTVFERSEGSEGFRGWDLVVVADVGRCVGWLDWRRGGLVGGCWGGHVRKDRELQEDGFRLLLKTSHARDNAV